MRGWSIPFIALALLTVPAATATGLLEEGPVNELTAPASNAAWARQAVAELPRATAVNDHDGDKLFDTLEEVYRASPGQSVDVVVSFTHDTATEDGLAAVREVVPTIAPTNAFHIIPGLAAPLTVDQALRVASLDVVRQLEHDRPGTLELDTATASMGADIVADELAFTGDRDGNETTYTPDDVVIAVLDTGFHGDHADLDEGKLLHFEDLGNGQEEAYDPSGHGTHVASIAAGTGDGDDRYRGVAPGAGLVGLKITDNDGQTSSLSLAIEGYEWIVDHKDEYGLEVATISFGFGTATDGTTALERAVDATWEAGIVCFKSTGNGGPERRTITVPAAARGILATGAMLDPTGDEQGSFGLDQLRGFGFSLATFSSRGPTTDGRVKPDIAAPGVSVTAAEAGTSKGYVAFSGTSMASPFAAGTAALVLDANPALTPDEVREVLTSTAEDWGLTGADVDYGAGRIQVVQAVAEAARRASAPLEAPTPVVPFHEVRAGKLASPNPFDPTAAVAPAATFEVNDTDLPLAITAIVEGALAQVVVQAPDGAIVASVQPLEPIARQHVVGFQPTEPGTYTVHLAGAPGTPFVLDLSHGQAGGLTIQLPGSPLETAGAEGVDDTTDIPALGSIVVLVAVLAVARVRRW